MPGARKASTRTEYRMGAEVPRWEVPLGIALALHHLNARLR
jgi:hypothetical protein